MRIKNRAALLGLVGGVLCSSARPDPGDAQELHLDRTAPSVVRFVSRTRVDEFEGVSDRIDGYVVLAEHEQSASTLGSDEKVYFEVDLASLDTGIGLRNRHMRENYLEVEKYPYASFDGRIVRSGSIDAATGVTAVGVFTVHGVSREREIGCNVAASSRGYRADCSFQVLLSDHAIEIPKVMFLKLANEIDVHVEFTLSLAAGQPEGAR